MPNKDPRGYYLDDLTPHDVATPDYLAQQIQDHTILMDLLGIPRNDKKKNELGQKVTVIYTNKIEARLPIDKLEHARQAAAKAVTTGSISLVGIQSLAGFLSFRSYHLEFFRIWIPYLLQIRQTSSERTQVSFQTLMECSS
ncbi:hypothetical protein V8E54_012331 [Elaphomyces granulatus]